MEQTERAYQKQEVRGKKGSRNRYYKSIGLGYKTPREAINGHYIDKKCPFTSDVKIRGHVITGLVMKLKMNRTAVIRRDYLHFVKKYNRFEKRHKNISVHVSPAFRDIGVGDTVIVGECRPLAKTVSFNVLKISKASSDKSKKSA